MEILLEFSLEICKISVNDNLYSNNILHRSIIYENAFVKRLIIYLLYLPWISMVKS